MRMRLTVVSAVSAVAAKIASTSPSANRVILRLMARLPRARRMVGGLTRSSEQLADAASLVDPHDGLGDKGCDGEDAKLGVVVEGPRLAERDGVGDADLVDRRLMQPLQPVVTEHPVGGNDIDPGGAAASQGMGGTRQGGAGADQVVDDHASLSLDVADDVEDLDIVI